MNAPTNKGVAGGVDDAMVQRALDAFCACPARSDDDAPRMMRAALEAAFHGSGPATGGGKGSGREPQRHWSLTDVPDDAATPAGGSDALEMVERLEQEAALTDHEWTNTPTLNPPSKPYHKPRVRALLTDAAALIRRLASAPARVGEADWDMAQHWIDRYAADVDDEPQLDRIAEALGLPDPTQQNHGSARE